MFKTQILSCPVCGQNLSTEESLSRHVNEHFVDDKKDYSQKCSYPGCFAVIKEKELDDHLLAHKMGEENPLSPVKADTQINLNDSLLTKLAQDDENAASNSVMDDYTLAQKVQKEDNKEMEEQEFKKLQEMYGMTGNGGFVKQFDEKMARQVGRKCTVAEYYNRKTEMLTAVLSGNDGGETATAGIIGALKAVYSKGLNKIYDYHISVDTDHYAGSVSDHGWGCGYRNLQMLISSLFKQECYKQYLIKGLESNKVPSIPKLQSLIEKAWHDGFDRAGCEQLGGKLQGTRKWIGSTEVATLLRSFKIRAKIMDFHKYTAPDNTHPILFQWIHKYFKDRDRNVENISFPLYIQHQGHSRLCVGTEEHTYGGEISLLLFDPSIKNMKNVLVNLRKNNSNQTKVFRKSLKQMKYKQLQLVYIDGCYDSTTEYEESKILSSIRIPDQ